MARHTRTAAQTARRTASGEKTAAVSSWLPASAGGARVAVLALAFLGVTLTATSTWAAPSTPVQAQTSARTHAQSRALTGATGAGDEARDKAGDNAGMPAVQASAVGPTPNVAFFYGPNPPVDELQAFDAVVVDPHSGFAPLSHPLKYTQWFARLDATPAPGDANAYVDSVIEPLWQRGYRGFLANSTVGAAVIGAIHTRHPDARLIVEGPGALTNTVAYAGSLYAVVGDSLIWQRNAGAPANTPVPADQRVQRIAAAKAFRASTHVPVLDIEHCVVNDRACARDTARQVIAAGLTPYVSDDAMDQVGIGRIEVMPRKILVIQDRNTGEPLDLAVRVHNVAGPLNYLGYTVEYADLDKPLPADITPDRYAGVVVWIDDESLQIPNWRPWLAGLIDAHVPIAFFGRFGFDVGDGAGAALGLEPVRGPFTSPVVETSHDPMVNFEIDPRPDPRDVQGVRITGSGGQSLLRLSANGVAVDQMGIMPWGGFALTPFKVMSLNGVDMQRWGVQPIAFLTRALRLQPMPTPSLTTENGLRLLMTHVDGDGFASRAEFPGPDYSGEALYERIFTKYKIPMLLSVIEGEVGPSGLYPAISPRLEQIARKVFALPNVEIGSHTYTHVFNWEDVDPKTGERLNNGDSDRNFSLHIPGYKFDLNREIAGSINYINTQLAPPGKKVEVLQWPGDCHPPALAVRMAYEAGVYNMNGGDTVITKAANSWTNIAPVGVDKGPGAYQVYAPNQDENVYTNDWLGPFYGFTRVLETFAMTDAPLRFKPIDIYYHMYTGTKEASLHALEEVLNAVLKQPVSPVYVTEYIRKVLDWRTFAVAHELSADPANSSGGDWVVRGNGEVREVHWQPAGAPVLASSLGVSGFADGPDGIYIHIPNGAGRFAIDSTASTRTQAQPSIRLARGFVKDFRRMPDGMQFGFAGHYEPYILFANAQQCSVTVDGQAVRGSVEGTSLRVSLPAQMPEKMSYATVGLHCGR